MVDADPDSSSKPPKSLAVQAHEASHFVENRCTYCMVHGSSKVIDSRWDPNFEGIRRRRECVRCKFRWTTLELDLDQVGNLLGMDLSGEK